MSGQLRGLYPNRLVARSHSHRWRFLTLPLHLEGIRSLNEGVCRILILFFSATKEAEAAASALQRLLGLLSLRRQLGCGMCVAGEGHRVLVTF